MSAGTVEPGDSDAIPELQMGDSRPEGNHDTGAFVARDERWRGLHGPVAVGRMQVRMTYTTGDNFHKGLPWAGHRHGNLLND